MTDTRWDPTYPWLALPDNRPSGRPALPDPPTVDDVVAAFRRWLHLPDPYPLYVMLGTVAANLLDGDPVWTMLVGPPASGKTELLGSLGQLDGSARSGLAQPKWVPDWVHTVSTFTKAAVLTLPNTNTNGGEGGLLMKMKPREEHPHFGILVFKDFTTMLRRASTTGDDPLAELREVYDGRMVREFGVAGGRSVTWEGKAGCLAAVTETIELAGAEMGSMGERFLYCRMPEGDTATRTAAAMQAMRNRGRQADMRAELARTVLCFFKMRKSLARPPTTPPAERAAWATAQPDTPSDERVAAVAELAGFVARCRTPVERDRFGDRDIEMVPQAEWAARMTAGLAQLLAGLAAIGLDDEKAWAAVVRVGLDSIPKMRFAVLRSLATAPAAETRNVADALGSDSTKAVGRVLGDLAAHHVIDRSSGSNGAHHWGMTAETRQRWGQFVGQAEPPSETVVQLDQHRSSADVCSLCGGPCEPEINPHPGCVETGVLW